MDFQQPYGLKLVGINFRACAAEKILARAALPCG
jgi:hypothetical protein